MFYGPRQQIFRGSIVTTDVSTAHYFGNTSDAQFLNTAGTAATTPETNNPVLGTGGAFAVLLKFWFASATTSAGVLNILGASCGVCWDGLALAATGFPGGALAVSGGTEIVDLFPSAGFAIQGAAFTNEAKAGALIYRSRINAAGVPAVGGFASPNLFLALTTQNGTAAATGIITGLAIDARVLYAGDPTIAPTLPALAWGSA